MSLRRLISLAEPVVTAAIICLNVMIMVAGCSRLGPPRPKTPAEVREVTTYLRSATGHGSGVILSSSKAESLVLTNAHVCDDFMKQGGIVSSLRGSAIVEEIKMSKSADLCLVKVKKSFGTSPVDVAQYDAPFGEEVIAGGFPVNLPLIVRRGVTSVTFTIQDTPQSKPELVQSTGVIVQPGDSGSGVFDSRGRLVGVMMSFEYVRETDSAGFGLAIPASILNFFLDREVKILKWLKVPRAASI